MSSHICIQFIIYESFLSSNKRLVCMYITLKSAKEVFLDDQCIGREKYWWSAGNNEFIHAISDMNLVCEYLTLFMIQVTMENTKLWYGICFHKLNPLGDLCEDLTSPPMTPLVPISLLDQYTFGRSTTLCEIFSIVPPCSQDDMLISYIFLFL